MGVYHFMGLGRSVGVVTTAVSYLVERYQRWSAKDQSFFGLSGETGQTGKRGDIQAIVLFTTPEVRQGQVLCEDYVDNPPGQMRGSAHKGGQMRAVLLKLLRREVSPITGGRPTVKLYWCDIHRTDLTPTFERVVKTLSAAKRPGELDKEVWINLTGGSNVVNAALQLANTLAGGPARAYYIQVAGDEYVRYTIPKDDIGTERDRFWNDFPVVPLQWDAARQALLQMVEALGSVSLDGLLERLMGKYGGRFRDINEVDTKEDRLRLFKRLYLVPLVGQELVRWGSEGIRIGSRWRLLSRYYQVLADVQRATITLGELARSESGWFSEEEI